MASFRSFWEIRSLEQDWESFATLGAFGRRTAWSPGQDDRMKSGKKWMQMQVFRVCQATTSSAFGGSSAVADGEVGVVGAGEGGEDVLD